MDLGSLELSQIFLVAWKGNKGGVTDLRVVTLGDSGSTVPDHTPYI